MSAPKVWPDTCGGWCWQAGPIIGTAETKSEAIEAADRMAAKLAKFPRGRGKRTRKT